MTEIPISPPPELVVQWCMEAVDHLPSEKVSPYIAKRAVQWGADQELEACCEWISKQDLAWMSAKDWTWMSAQLRAARRPKPPSLKEQALKALLPAFPGPGFTDKGERFLTSAEQKIILRALESIPDETT